MVRHDRIPQQYDADSPGHRGGKDVDVYVEPPQDQWRDQKGYRDSAIESAVNETRDHLPQATRSVCKEGEREQVTTGGIECQVVVAMAVNAGDEQPDA